MFPLSDDIPSRKTPLVNLAIIGASSVMFLAQMLAGSNGGLIVERLGMVPARLTVPAGEVLAVPEQVVVPTIFGYQRVERLRPLESASVPEWLTLLTCIFLHGGWLHFLGNMWFLHVFGDNVEDRLGHVSFFVLYLGCGVISSITHMVTNFDSVVPTIGASGAIAGVMGAYMLMFPRAQVMTVLPMIFFWPVWIIPAPIFLGLWFALQFFNGAFVMQDTQAGGVAWWAHIGGFVAGAAIAAGINALHGNRNPQQDDLSIVLEEQ